jgi:integrase
MRELIRESMKNGKHLLTHPKIQSLLKLGKKCKVRDGNGLWLTVSGPNYGSWVSRYTVTKKGNPRGSAKEIGLGSYPTVSLKDARERHEQNKMLASTGVDPSTYTEPTKKTFEAVFVEYFGYKKETLNNDKNIKQWQSTMDAYVFPVIGDQGIDHITHHDIAEILNPIWSRIPDTASKVLQRINNVFEYAIAHDYRITDNPAKIDRIKHILPSIASPIKQANYPFIPPERFPALYQHLKSEWSLSTGLKKSTLGALIFACLTTARSQTVRLLKWDDVELNEGLWLPPPNTMKAGREVRYPLSKIAVEFLKQMDLSDEYVFPSSKLQPLRDHALSNYLRIKVPDHLIYSDSYDEHGVKKKAVPHGIRSTFSTWANEQGFDDLIIEKCLAHADRNKVRAAYQRSDLTERRRELFEAWAIFISSSQS